MNTYKILLTCILVVSSIFGVLAQSAFKEKERPQGQKLDVSLFGKLDQKWPVEYSVNDKANRILSVHKPIHMDLRSPLKIKVQHENSYFISGTLPHLRNQNAETSIHTYMAEVAALLDLDIANTSFEMSGQVTDDLDMIHYRLQQTFDGIPVYGGEVLLHRLRGQIHSMNGTIYPPRGMDDAVLLSQDDAREKAFAFLAKKTKVQTEIPSRLDFLSVENTSELVYYPMPGKWVAAWHLLVMPNIGEQWELFIHAGNGSVIQAHSRVCRFHYDHTRNSAIRTPKEGTATIKDGAAFFNPTTGTAPDLAGIERTIQIFDDNGTFVLFDASRPMFQTVGTQTQEPRGVIITYDAQNTYPGNDDFTVRYITSNDRDSWDAAAVSAHHHAGIVYEFFRTVFNRNSINGLGGNVLSLINVSDEDGQDMDNAFWNGVAMFYGNGNVAFDKLAEALDVAAHEIGHGVIQNTANLQYLNESGALNESFADIFGVLVDDDDWQLGEDIVNTNIFPSGALRDMADPHNGGVKLGDRGWQPKSTGEQYRGNEDNGGVHINSGIPNYAFHLFATDPDVGLAEAGRIFYRALTTYLVKSSVFVDLRIAVVQAATDFHGQDSRIVQVARDAFDSVGILGETSTDHQEELDPNTGDDIIMYISAADGLIYIVDENGTPLSNGPLSLVAPVKRPSVTDDGSLIVFVGEDGVIRALLIDWETGMLDELTLNFNVPFKKAVISRDGRRMAALTDETNEFIYVLDLVGNEWRQFELYNPTTVQGVATDDVLYADEMEFDFSGGFLMYDAFNRISNASAADITYWDIGFLQVWDNQSDTWGSGNIVKLFSAMPAGIAVGNPTFAKNAPFILAFDLVEETDDGNDYFLMAANVETGDLETVVQNSQLSFPNYSIRDNFLLFDAESNQGSSVLGIVPMAENRLNSAGQAQLFINNAQKGVWFGNGTRDLSTAVIEPPKMQVFEIYPNPVESVLRVRTEDRLHRGAEATIYNLLGQPVHTAQIRNDSNSFDIPVDHLPAGAYFLSVRGDSIKGIMKFLKK